MTNVVCWGSSPAIARLFGGRENKDGVLAHPTPLDKVEPRPNKS
jgi:hypothetical protein